MKLDLKELIAKMSAYTKDTYIVEALNVPFSFSSQRYKEVTKDVSKTGYTPLGIVGWSFSTIDWYLSRLSLTGTTATLMIFRTANISASANVDIYVLYRKNP